MMRLVTLLVATLLCLMLPTATVGASPFASTVVRTACTTEGGRHGFGKVLLKVGAVEFGKSGANYMVFRARLQERLNGQWVNVDRSKWRTDTFPNDGASWSWWYRAKWSFDGPKHPLTRVTMRVQFWSERPGPDLLLLTHRHAGAAC